MCDYLGVFLYHRFLSLLPSFLSIIFNQVMGCQSISERHAHTHTHSHTHSHLVVIYHSQATYQHVFWRWEETGSTPIEERLATLFK